MKIAMDVLCRVFSRGLDIIEEEQIGASEHHSMRVAALCAAMGKKLGYDDDTRSALATCALFHDNALTEHHLSLMELNSYGPNMILHCKKGQDNVSWLPFKKDISGMILYHHEKGHGKGPFKKKEGEYPFEAALISVADSVDIYYKLQNINADRLSNLQKHLTERPDAYATGAAMDVLLEVLNREMLESLRDENISKTLDNILPQWEVDVTDKSVIGIAGFIAHMIDYKSNFTQKHTSQIANRAWLMAKHYGYCQEERAALYLAASLHDIGKIATPIDVLEKPGKLSYEEFEIIKKHVRDTHDWLSEIPNFELIRNWAANHHEKLDGSGYSSGKKAIELDFNSRLIACLDIYQAVSEARPYHDARPHNQTMSILYNMSAKAFIDSRIVADLDDVMGEYSFRDVPPPLKNE